MLTNQRVQRSQSFLNEQAFEKFEDLEESDAHSESPKFAAYTPNEVALPLYVADESNEAEQDAGSFLCSADPGETDRRAKKGSGQLDTFSDLSQPQFKKTRNTEKQTI